MFKSCPKCGSPSFDGELKCRCGNEFDQSEVTASADNLELENNSGDAKKLWGACLIAAGVLLSGYAFFAYDVTASTEYVPSDVINIGQLQNQLMVFQAGLAAFLAGVICLGTSR